MIVNKAITLPALLSILCLYWYADARESSSITVSIIRKCKGEHEIIGELYVDEKKVGYSLERIWKRNASQISSIPSGVYSAVVRKDGKIGWRLELIDVPGRENIQIHVGNWVFQTTGCILIGKEVVLGGAVLNSNKALKELRRLLKEKSKLSRHDYKNKLCKNKDIIVEVRDVDNSRCIKKKVPLLKKKETVSRQSSTDSLLLKFKQLENAFDVIDNDIRAQHLLEKTYIEKMKHFRTVDSWSNSFLGEKNKKNKLSKCRHYKKWINVWRHRRHFSCLDVCCSSCGFCKGACNNFCEMKGGCGPVR